MQYYLSIDVEPDGSGSTEPSEPGCWRDSGIPIVLTASPGSGNVFHQWTGDVIGFNNPETIIMDGSKSIVAHFAGSLEITTDQLQAGTVGAFYEQAIDVAGGVWPLSWSLQSGDLPPGLSLNSNTGVISGMPGTTGTYNLTVEVRDSRTPQQTDARAYSLKIDPAPTFEVRINAGGDAYTDTNGKEWQADRAYTVGGYGCVGGGTYTTDDPISGTEDDVLYQSERWGMSAYQFDVPNGTYQVTLHLAEIYCTRDNKRMMSVAIEDQTVLQDLDIHDEVGHDAAVWYTFSNSAITDGRLDISFTSTREQPKISAIEVKTSSSQPILSVTPDILDFGSSQTTLIFSVQNNGTAILNWAAAETPQQSWLTSITPSSGSLSAGANVPVTVTVDRAGIAPANDRCEHDGI